MQNHSFLKKEVLRAYRDINACMNDLINNTGRTMFHVNIKRFILLIETNSVLKYLLDPFWNLDVSTIEDDDDGWIELEIPTQIDYQIAYLLKKYKELSKEDDEYCIHNFLYDVFRNKSGEVNTQYWNKSIVKPCFREIIFRLDDMIEDLPDKEEINKKYMSIITVGTINNTNGNVGIGENITQSLNSEDIFKEIIELVNKNIPNDEREEVLKVVEEMKRSKSSPSFKGKITEFITITAKYASVFMKVWGTLENMK